jgi:DNA modification methylase
MAFPSKAEAEAQGLSDNWVASMPGVEDDSDKLAEILLDFQEQDIDFSGLGKEAEDLAKLLADDANNALAGDGSGSEETTGDDEAPAEDSGPVHSKQGEIYQLGPHLLLCGDCRNPDDVRRLLDGHKVNLAFTSPPYASQRKYDESSGFKPIPPDEYVEWFEAVQANVREHLAPDGSWFVNIKEGSADKQRDLYCKDLLISHVRAWKWLWIDEFCWLRQSLPGDPNSMGKFKNGFEPTYHFAVSKEYKFNPRNVQHESTKAFDYETQKAAGRSINASSQGKGNNAQSPVGHGVGLAYPSNVLDIMEGANVEGHSAAFPVRFPSFFIKAYTDPGDLVYEPFMGSGTTMIASAKEGRVCRGIEISPKYCDVIRRRWTKWAKQNNRPVGSGGLE